MSDTLGNKLKLTIFGASHAPEIGVTISSLPKGMKVDDVISRLKGIDCRMRGTSCPDQLARALEAYKNNN